MGAALPYLEETRLLGDHRPPLLARCFSPAGPPRLCRLSARDAAVASVPGRYSVTHVIEGPQTRLCRLGVRAVFPAHGPNLVGKEPLERLFGRSGN